VLALTLFFAVAAGAQEEKTDTEGVGAQAAEVQQQQVPNDQQRVVVVQKQQLGTAAADAPLSGPLAGARVIVRKDTQPKNSIDKGDVLRIKGNYEVSTRSGPALQ